MLHVHRTVLKGVVPGRQCGPRTIEIRVKSQDDDSMTICVSRLQDGDSNDSMTIYLSNSQDDDSVMIMSVEEHRISRAEASCMLGSM